MTKQEIIDALKIKYDIMGEDLKNDYDSFTAGVLYGIDEALELIKKLNEPKLKQGYWIDRKNKIACSVCNYAVYLGTEDVGVHELEKKNFKFCPVCGTDMRGNEK